MKRLLLFVVLLCGGMGVALAQGEQAPVVLNIDSNNYYIHRVVAGESVADIATLYSLAEKEVLDENNLDPIAPAIAEGDYLRIPCYERVSKLQPRRSDSRYDRHRIVGGESLFKVAVDYAISLDTLVADNAGLDVTNLRTRSSLYVRRSAMGKSQLSDIRQQSGRYFEVLSALSHNYRYVVVGEGETLYSIATKLGLYVDDLSEWNGSPEFIYEGMLLKYEPSARDMAVAEQEQQSLVTTDIVEYLDSLSADGVRFRPFEKDVLTVSLMLPLSDTLGRVRGSFVEFFQGAELAARECQKEGLSVTLQLFDTKNSPSQVERLVRYDSMIDNTDLFIGPIYERNQEAVVEYAAERGVAMVSPLASTTNGSYGRHYYRLSPTPKSRVEKLGGLVGPETNVIMVYTASNDDDMEREVLAMLDGHPYGKVIYDENFVVDSLNSRPIEELMATEDNLFVVLSDNEIDTDRSLAIISSMMNSRQPKYGTRRVPIRVLGNANWAKYRNMDKNLLFKLDVTYLAPYHADRSSELVREFDRKFMAAYGRAPSMFAYRAYDAVRLFVTAMYAGGDLAAELNGAVVTMLQTRYSFIEEEGNMVNDTWMLVNYRPNYTIEVR